jgi:DnaJ-class molecular chaperone
MSKRDYCDVLGVEKNADDAALKSAFRKLAMHTMNVDWNDLYDTLR